MGSPNVDNRDARHAEKGTQRRARNTAHTWKLEVSVKEETFRLYLINKKKGIKYPYLADGYRKRTGTTSIMQAHSKHCSSMMAKQNI